MTRESFAVDGVTEGRQLLRSRLSMLPVLLLAVLLSAWSAASCVVDVPHDLGGFPCNPDGSCEGDLICVAGVCVTDPCLTVSCALDELCSDGECVPLHCAVPCRDGEICWEDACTPIACIGVECPPDAVCVDGDCLAGCLVDRDHFATSVRNPANDCLACEPSTSTVEWTPLPYGTGCGVGGACDGFGLCVAIGCEEDCPDLDAWYDVQMEEYACCDDGRVCSCREQEYRSHSCVDGICDFSITDERTSISDCRSCDDLNPCTINDCNEGACITDNLVAGTPCGTTGECDGQGLCSQGCEIDQIRQNAGAINTENECEYCNPALHETAWSARDGVSCEAGDECSQGECLGGNCVPEPFCDGTAEECGCESCVDCSLLDGWVDDGVPYFVCEDSTNRRCSAQDQNHLVFGCEEMQCEPSVSETRTTQGSCVICDDSNDCTLAGCADGACVFDPAPEGTSCGISGECDGNGSCSEGCSIDGVFFSDGVSNPDDPCNFCSFSSDPTDWTSRPVDTVCGDGRVCDFMGECAPRCSLPWGSSVGHGETVTAYQVASAACGGICPSEQRECEYGILLGSYQHQSCSEFCSSCGSQDLTWGDHECSASVPAGSHAQQHTVGNTNEGRTGSATFVCNDGSWERSTGSICQGNDCALPWGGFIDHGQSITAYAQSSAPCGFTCNDQTRTCSYGDLSGSHEHQDCLVSPCADCNTQTLSWGGAASCESSVQGISHGGSRTVSNSAAGRSGEASFECNDGSWVLRPDWDCTADSTTITLGPTDDGYEIAPPTYLNWLDFYLLTFGYNQDSGGYRYTPLLKFDLSSLSGKTIESATLRLYAYDREGTGSFALYARRVTSSWLEDGTGIPVTRSNTNSAQTTISATPAFYEWDLTSLVQSWASGTANHGLALVSTHTTHDYGWFYSKEASDSAPDPKPPAEQLPRLIVTYY